jgi:hypothetical protein
VSLEYLRVSTAITNTHDQAQFRPEYFLAFILPDFKSKILTQLSEAKKEDGPTLFNILGQCFQYLGLIEGTNVVG